jgi:hypothetical protein
MFALSNRTPTLELFILYDDGMVRRNSDVKKAEVL